MPTFVLYAAIGVLIVVALLFRSVAKLASKEATYLSSFVALMCIEEDVYRNNAPDFKRWVLENIDVASLDTRSVYSVNKAASRMAANFLDQLGGPSIPLYSIIAQLKKSR